MKELLEAAIRMLDQMHAELEELHSQLPWVAGCEIADLKRKVDGLEIEGVVKKGSKQ